MPPKGTPSPTAIPKNWNLPVFNIAIRVVWAISVMITVLSEVIPIPLMPRVAFYTYACAKGLLFISVGYLTPLSFWRFNALNRGMVFAAASAALVEGAQALIHHGHSFHWYELVGKLILLFIGFALALDARYERQINLFVAQIKLTGEHLDGNPS